MSANGNSVMSLVKYERSLKSAGQHSTGIDAVLAVVRAKETRVELASKGVTAAGLDVLVAASVARTLTFLDLSSNRLGNVGVKILSESLLGRSGPSSPIRALHLRDCFIGADGAFALAAALPSAPSLELLDISDNMLQSRGVSRIADALPSCGNLSHLLADSCYALSAGSAALARGAQRAPRLAHLSMANNHPGDAGYTCIAELIKCSPVLHCIDASGTASTPPYVCGGGGFATPHEEGCTNPDETQQDASQSFGMLSAVDRSTSAAPSAAAHLASTSTSLSSALTTVMGETVFGHRRSGLRSGTVEALADGLRAAVSTRVVHLRGLQLPSEGLRQLLQALQGDPALRTVGTVQELHFDNNAVSPAYATACGDAAITAAEYNWRLCHVSLHNCGISAEQLQTLSALLAQNSSKRHERQANEGIHEAIEQEQQRVAALAATLAAEHAAATQNKVSLGRTQQNSLQLRDSLGQSGLLPGESKSRSDDASSVHSATDSLSSGLRLVSAINSSDQPDFPGADPQLQRQLRDLRHTHSQLQDSVPRASAAASCAHRSLHGAQEELQRLQSAVAVARAQREAMLQEQTQLEGDIAQLRAQQQQSEEAAAAHKAREGAARSAAAALKAQLEALQDSIAAGHAELRAMRATRLAMSQDILPAMHAAEANARRAAASAAQLEADLRGRLASTAALADAVQHQVANERHRMTMLPQQQLHEPVVSSPVATRTIIVSPRSDPPSPPVPSLPLQTTQEVDETIMPDLEAHVSETHVSEIAVGPDTPPPTGAPSPKPQPPPASLPECLMDLVDTEGSALTVHCGIAMRSAQESSLGSVTVHSVAWPPAQALRRESDGQPWSPDGQPDSEGEADAKTDSVVVDLRSLYQFGVSPWDALLELRVSGGGSTPRSPSPGSALATPTQLGSPQAGTPHAQRVAILSSWLSAVRVFSGDITTVSLQCALVLPEVPSTIRLQLRNTDSAIALLQALLQHVPERLQRSVNEALQTLDPPSPLSSSESVDALDDSPAPNMDAAQEQQEEQASKNQTTKLDSHALSSGGGRLPSPAPAFVEVADAPSPGPAPAFVEVADAPSPGPGISSPGFREAQLEQRPAGHGNIDAPVFPPSTPTSTPRAHSPYTPFSDVRESVPASPYSDQAAGGEIAVQPAPEPQMGSGVPIDASAAPSEAGMIEARPPVSGFVLTEPPGWGQHNPVSYSPRGLMDGHGVQGHAGVGSVGQAAPHGSSAVLDGSAAPPVQRTAHSEASHKAPGILDPSAVPNPPDDASAVVVESIRGYTWKMLQELWAAQTLPKYGELRKHVAKQLNYGGGVLKGKEWRAWFRATVDDLLATLYAQSEAAEEM